MIDVHNLAVFTMSEVVAITGSTRRKIERLATKGLVLPIGEKTNLYTWFSVIEIKAILKLRDSGVSLKKISDAIDFLSDWLGKKPSLADKRIMVLDGDIYFYENEFDAESAKTYLVNGKVPGQSVLIEILDLGAIEDQCVNQCKVLGLEKRLNHKFVS